MPNLPTKPSLLVKEILDANLRKNFQSLSDYFRDQRQLQDFRFIEIVFTAAETNRKVAHGVGQVPQDLVRSHMSGVGTVTFHRGSFDSTNLVVSSTGAARVRLYVGNGLLSTPSPNTASSDEEVWNTNSGDADSSLLPGMLMFWPSPTAPSGWLLYTDSALNRTEYPTLFALFGETYIQSGDAAGTFRLPPGQGRVPVIAGNGSGLTARAFGTTGGEEEHVLTVDEMPAHTHSNDGMNVPGAFTAAAGVNKFVNTGASGSTGGDDPHNNMQPFVVWYAIIKL